jgi:protein-disulfide isomerase
MKSLNWSLLVGLTLTFFLLGQPSSAQQASVEDVKKEIETLSESVKMMQKDLQEIKTLLQSRMPSPPPQNVILDLGNQPFRGENTAKVTLIEFSDYQCPYCSRHARETLPQIEKEYIQTGKVRYTVKSLPMEAIHKSAFKAAEAAGCAGEQGKFWEMYNRLFGNQKELDQWKVHAEAIGLDVPKFEECMTSGRQAGPVRSDIAEAQKAGVTGTPAFFLAYTDAKSTTVKTVTRLVGAQPYASFKTAIDKLLVETQAAPER